MSIKLVKTGITISSKPTCYECKTVENYKLLVPNLKPKITDESTRLEKAIEDSLKLGDGWYGDYKAVSGDLCTLKGIKDGKAKKEHLLTLKDNNLLKIYSIGEALSLLNALLKVPLVQRSNNEQFMIPIAFYKEDFSWIGFHRGNSRNYRFWFCLRYIKELEFFPSLGNYFIS